MSANYDVDVGTVLVSDWSHETAFIDFFQELDGGVPEMQTNLLNGTGCFFIPFKPIEVTDSLTNRTKAGIRVTRRTPSVSLVSQNISR